MKNNIDNIDKQTDAIKGSFRNSWCMLHIVFGDERLQCLYPLTTTHHSGSSPALKTDEFVAMVTVLGGDLRRARH